MCDNPRDDDTVIRLPAKTTSGKKGHSKYSYPEKRY